MAVDDDTVFGNGSPSDNPDPLGIIGWVIGGKYKIERYISGGGFGEVYAGFNQNLVEQRVVIKFFKRVQAREKFDKEAKILCQLDHPNISRVIDYLPDEGAVIVAFIDGQDGSHILKESGALSEALFVKVARSMTSAIAYAHEKKIAHRDIKPGNILIDKRQNVYLIDFGIAKEIGGDATKTAYTALTPMFAAPERQAGEKDYNPFISDIYEMGVTLFNFATNSLPYRNPVNPDINEWGGSVAKKLSPELRRILIKATHPDPNRRYTSARQMAVDLEKLEKAFGGAKKSSFKYVLLVLLALVIGFAGWEYGPQLWQKFFPAGRLATQTTPAVTAPPEEQTEPEVSPETPEKPAQSSDTPAEVKPVPVQRRQPEQKPEEQKPAEQPPVEPKPIETKPVETVPQPPPEKPAPTPKALVTIRTLPSEDMALTIDGRSQKPGSRFEITPGRHNIVAMHPDYPIYVAARTFEAGTQNITIDLKREFPDMTVADMQLALSPPSETQILEMTFNGRKKTLTNFPAFDLQQGTGTWEVSLKLRPLSSGTAARVDSCVTYPYGGGPRHALLGSTGRLTIELDDPGQAGLIPMVVYWSSQ